MLPIGKPTCWTSQGLLHAVPLLCFVCARNQHSFGPHPGSALQTFLEVRQLIGVIDSVELVETYATSLLACWRLHRQQDQAAFAAMTCSAAL